MGEGKSRRRFQGKLSRRAKVPRAWKDDLGCA